MNRDGDESDEVAQILAAKPESVVPRQDLTGSGNVGKPQKFSDYVARQLGFKDGSECPKLSNLASEYARNSEDFKKNMDDYFSNEKEKEKESLCVKLVEELERCILGYFAFHWSQVSYMINQVLSDGSEEKGFKNRVLTATSKQRIEKITKDLKVTRAISTILEEMKVINSNSPKGGNGDGEDAFTKASELEADGDRSPVLLLMGGGMGAGKSTVLKEILKDPFWAGAAKNAVVVEADAFKETDVLYQALNKGHHSDMLQTSELVHQSSTDAASSLLVTALNDGRDVIMDGTLAWEPYLDQTVEMVKNVHKYRYRMGPGYKVLEGGEVIEDYWEKVENEEVKVKKPYKIELVGVVCDPYLAVTRGIRRAIAVKRAVRVSSQLQSHKRFANAFRRYCDLVHVAKLFCTDGMGVPPTVIAYKNANGSLVEDPQLIKCLETLHKINDKADSIYELYADQKILTDDDSAWKKHVLTPGRTESQRDLKVVIEKIEKSTS